MTDKKTFMIIIPAYRESNLPRLVGKLLSEKKPGGFAMGGIIIVACDCDELSLKILAKRKTVRIIKEASRKGKASSINAALSVAKAAKADVIVMESADTTPKAGTLSRMLIPFSDENVGMTAARPVPTNDRRTFVGFLAHTVWSLHHIISMSKPKAGEMVAFRNIVGKLPKNTVADESYIERAIVESGKSIRYVPEAIVSNSGPSTLGGFFEQRRRVFLGHVQAMSDFGYAVSTVSPLRVLSSTVSYVGSLGPKEMLWLAAAIFIEVTARLAGMVDYYVLRNIPYKWKLTK